MVAASIKDELKEDLIQAGFDCTKSKPKCKGKPGQNRGKHKTMITASFVGITQIKQEPGIKVLVYDTGTHHGYEYKTAYLL